MKVVIIDQISKVNYKYTFSLCNQLVNNDVDLILINDQKKDMNECKIDYKQWFNSTEDSNKISKGINYISAWRKVISLIKEKKIDILHVQWFLLSPIDYYFISKAKKLGIKILVTIHDILPFNTKFYDYKYHKKIYQIADSIIVQGEVNKTKLLNLFPDIENLQSKTVYIPHGNFVDYVEEVKKNDARKYLNLPENKVILLFFGQIKKVKGLDVLIKAMKQVCDKRKDVLLVIAGKVWDDNFEVYDKLINENGLTDFIRGDIKYIADEDVKYYFGSSDVVILPYKNVYQSGVVQLAYSYKKPVIATNVGAFKEVVENEISGLLVPPDNVECLSNAILSMINDKEKLDKYGVNGYKIINDKFGWPEIASKVYNIYSLLINKSNQHS